MRRTINLWEQVLELSKKEIEAGGVLDMDTKIISTITSHGPGYLDKDKEQIVGFQTKITATSSTLLSKSFLQFTGKLIMQVFLMHIQTKCVLAAPATSSQAFPMHTAEVE